MPFSRSRWESARLVALASLVVGGLTLAWVYACDWNNLYGDGQAHLAIARKLADAPPGASWRDRYIQLGSPWLPLPHALAAPLAAFDTLWRTGLAGSFVSLAAFAIAAAFLFDLVADLTESKLAATIAWLTFALNPSLLYVQTTPLTEPLLLATLLGSVWHGRDWMRRGERSALIAFALWTLLAVLTRYEGWALLPAGLGVVALRSPRRGWARMSDIALWSGIAGAGVAYWLWHNWFIYGRPLEFLDGPYSARGYFARHQDELSHLSFVVGRPLYAGMVWAATVVICATPVTILFGGAGLAQGVAAALWRRRCGSPDALTLALTLPPPLFTGYSLYSGNIQIYPLFLNNRYGLVALPALAVGAGLSAAFLQRRFPARHPWLAAGLGLACLGQSLWLLRDGVYQLAVFQEAYRAQFALIGRERRALAQFLRAEVGQAQVALFAGDLSSVIARSGLNYAQIVHEGSPSWGALDSAIPPTVTWLVIGRGDALEMKLRQRPTGYEAFSTAWVSEQGTFTVLRRNP
ncbi:MAG: hypothetical protein CFK52_06545 [Chloracidobacterium sp. CP2_5A]|nr:MAG: hypothetical protein CFK52_06545 [Chloracidobacterium sp. CP2_5A]